MTRFVALFLVSGLLASCQLLHNLHALNSEKPELRTYRVGNKDVTYCAMHHLGKQVFYDEVARVVKEHKARGYVVYYEQVRSTFTADSVLRDRIRRKARKLKGTANTYKQDADAIFGNKYVAQPDNPALGTDAQDVWADVNYLQLINEYERLYGVIRLDSLDLATPFKAPYRSNGFTNKKQYNTLIVSYRTQHLLNAIKAGPHAKILVLYGEGHRKSFEKGIKAGGEV